MAREIEYSPITGRPIKIMDKYTKVVGLPDWDLFYVEFDSPKERDRIRGIIVRGAEEGMAAIKKITDRRIYFEPWIGVLETTGETRGGHPQEITMDEIKKLVDEVPDVNDPAKINYWVAKDDILIYLEGWSDECLAGTGFPLMGEGGHADKIAYIEDLTPGILKRKAEEKGLRLIEGGFMETEGATNLYGVTYGVYRKLGDQKGERTRDILRRAGYGV